MTHWHTVSNVAGYLPDSDAPADTFATWQEARAALRFDLEDARNALDYAHGLEPAEGQAQYDSYTEALTALETWPADLDVVIYTTDGGRHTLPTAWQVGACNALDCEEPEATNELETGYDKARRLYGDEYAEYLREHDAELAAKGFDLKPWPLSLQGNDGD